MALCAAFQQLRKASLDSATSVRAEGSLPAVSIATLADAPFIGWVGMGHGLLFDPDTCHVTRLPG